MNFRARAIIAALTLVPCLLEAQQQYTVTAVPPPAVTQVGAAVSGTPGQTSDCYWVVVNYVGGAVLPGRGQCLTNVPNTLSGSNYVQITWTALTGAVSYDVLKTTTNVGPIPGASVALATGLTTTTTNDQGGGLSAYTAAAFPYANARATYLLDNRNYLPPIHQFSDFAVGVRQLQGTLSTGLPIIPKGTSSVQIGNVTTPFSVDSTGAALNTVYSVESNVTIANINAGTVLVPAVTGRTLKVTHVLLRAIGGAVGTCTAVVVEDTTGSPVASITANIAQLTQNTVVTESTASVVIGTFGVTSLTANQGLQVAKTGGTCDTATSVWVVVFYKINS